MFIQVRSTFKQEKWFGISGWVHFKFEIYFNHYKSYFKSLALASKFIDAVSDAPVIFDQSFGEILSDLDGSWWS